MINRKDDTEQRAIVAILLSLAVYWIWQLFFVPPPQPVEEQVSPPVAEAPVQSAPGSAPSSAPLAEPPSDLPERSLPFETSGIRATLSSEGGGFREIALPEHEGAYEVTPIYKYVLGLIKGEGTESGWSPYGEEPGIEQVLTEDGLLIAAGSGGFAEGRYALTEEGETIKAIRRTGEGIVITKTYTPDEDGHFVDIEVRFDNAGDDPFSGPLWIGMSDIFSGEVSRYKNATRPAGVVDGDLEKQNDVEKLRDGAVVHEGAVSWFGIGDRYFMAAAIPEVEDWGRLTFAAGAKEGAAGVYLVRDHTLDPGKADILKLRVYIGSKNLSTLREIGHDLPESVEFGVFGFFSNILLWILNLFHSLVGNWGVAIILLTVSVKSAFWPLTQKSFKSSRAMQAVQPRIAALKEKYGDDPQKLGEEQMRIFREEGVNPLSGCLPMVIQMPVWFSLYSVLLSSSDVYHAKFLYLKDLSSADPYCVLPLLVGIFYFLQQRIQPTSPNMDPTQQKLMRMMPMFFVVFMFAFPSGLNIYILINTLLSITQMWLINRAYPVPEPVATTVLSGE